jgi:dihydroorotate dehydrogenase
LLRCHLTRSITSLEQKRQIARGRIQIKGNGGVSTGTDALAMLRAGAVCVDIYSAFIYRGWRVARDISCELIAAHPAASTEPTGTPAPPCRKES